MGARFFQLPNIKANERPLTKCLLRIRGLTLKVMGLIGDINVRGVISLAADDETKYGSKRVRVRSYLRRLGWSGNPGIERTYSHLRCWTGGEMLLPRIVENGL